MMKESLRKVLTKFRRTKTLDPPNMIAQPTREPRRVRTAAKRAEASAASHSPGFVATGTTRTGETIYGHHGLRFHSLTLNAADLAALENPSAFHGGFKIRVAKRPGGRKHARTLVETRYSGKGYITPQATEDPFLSTFIAYDEGTLVGTVSVRLDSKQGVSADDLYHEEIDALRKAGCKVCEFTRLAVDKTVASKPVLAGLFHTAYLYAAVIRGFTHAVIEVNPRHVTFYRRALDFEPIGVERLNPRVNAPAVLLAVSFQAIADGLSRYAGNPGASGAGRSLYPYGFPVQEESGVLERIRQLVNAG